MVMLFVEHVGRIGCLWAICRECGPICRECGSEVPPICTECEPNQGDICGPEGLRSWATTGIAEEENRQQGVDPQDIFSRVVLLLAALTRGLFRRVLGANDTPWRAV